MGRLDQQDDQETSLREEKEDGAPNVETKKVPGSLTSALNTFFSGGDREVGNDPMDRESPPPRRSMDSALLRADAEPDDPDAKTGSRRAYYPPIPDVNAPFSRRVDPITIEEEEGKKEEDRFSLSEEDIQNAPADPLDEDLWNGRIQAAEARGGNAAIEIVLEERDLLEARKANADEKKDFLAFARAIARCEKNLEDRLAELYRDQEKLSRAENFDQETGTASNGNGEANVVTSNTDPYIGTDQEKIAPIVIHRNAGPDSGNPDSLKVHKIDITKVGPAMMDRLSAAIDGENIIGTADNVISTGGNRAEVNVIPAALAPEVQAQLEAKIAKLGQDLAAELATLKNQRFLTNKERTDGERYIRRQYLDRQFALLREYPTGFSWPDSMPDEKSLGDIYRRLNEKAGIAQNDETESDRPTLLGLMTSPESAKKSKASVPRITALKMAEQYLLEEIGKSAELRRLRNAFQVPFAFKNHPFAQTEIRQPLPEIEDTPEAVEELKNDLAGREYPIAGYRSGDLTAESSFISILNTQIADCVQNFFGKELGSHEVDVMQLAYEILKLMDIEFRKMEGPLTLNDKINLIKKEYLRILRGYLSHFVDPLPASIDRFILNEGAYETASAQVEENTTPRVTKPKLKSTKGKFWALAAAGLTAMGASFFGGYYGLSRSTDPVRQGVTVSSEEDFITHAHESKKETEKIKPKEDLEFVRINADLQQIIDGEREVTYIGRHLIRPFQQFVFDNIKHPLIQQNYLKRIKKIADMLDQGSAVDLRMRELFAETPDDSKEIIATIMHLREVNPDITPDEVDAHIREKFKSKINFGMKYAQMIDIYEKKKIDFSNRDLGLEGDEQWTAVDAYNYFLSAFQDDLLKFNPDLINVDTVRQGQKIRTKMDGEYVRFVQDLFRAINLENAYDYASAAPEDGQKHGIFKSHPHDLNELFPTPPQKPENMLASTELPDGNVTVHNVLGAAVGEAPSIHAPGPTYTMTPDLGQDKLADIDSGWGDIPVTLQGFAPSAQTVEQLSIMGRTEAGAHFLETGKILLPAGADAAMAIENIYIQVCENDAQVGEIEKACKKNNLKDYTFALDDGRAYVQLPDHVRAEFEKALRKDSQPKIPRNDTPDIMVAEETVSDDEWLAMQIAEQDPFQNPGEVQGAMSDKINNVIG